MKITGTGELKRALQKGIKLDAVKKIVKLNGSEMQRKAQRHVAVDSGDNKRSIGLELKDSGLTAQVEPTMEYSAYQEYGTRFMEAQPYMRPAHNEQKVKFINDMKNLVK